MIISGLEFDLTTQRGVVQVGREKIAELYWWQVSITIQ
jgi:hypothetical protein